MKALYTLFSLLLFSIAYGQDGYLRVLPQDSVFVVLLKRVVVMDDHTFGKYHFTLERYDTLRHYVQTYQHQLDRLDSIKQSALIDLQELNRQKDTLITACQQSQVRLKHNLNLSMKETKDWQDRYLGIERKLQKKQRQSRFLFTTTITLSFVSIALIGI